MCVTTIFQMVCYKILLKCNVLEVPPTVKLRSRQLELIRNQIQLLPKSLNIRRTLLWEMYRDALKQQTNDILINGDPISIIQILAQKTDCAVTFTEDKTTEGKLVAKYFLKTNQKPKTFIMRQAYGETKKITKQNCAHQVIKDMIKFKWIEKKDEKNKK